MRPYSSDLLERFGRALDRGAGRLPPKPALGGVHPAKWRAVRIRLTAPFDSLLDSFSLRLKHIPSF